MLSVRIARFIVWSIPYVLLSVSTLPAEDDTGGISARIGGMRQLYGIEYSYPTEESRDITTINASAYFLLEEVKNLRLSLHAGVTGTFATGDITQLEGSLQEGTLREVTYENTAFGVGPGVAANVLVWRKDEFSLHLGGSGSLILYNKDFPAGGDFYNLMWRGGPVLQYALGNSQAVGLSYQWMHVSNGQGIGAQNPSYDARGPGLRFARLF